MINNQTSNPYNEFQEFDFMKKYYLFYAELHRDNSVRMTFVADSLEKLYTDRINNLRKIGEELADDASLSNSYYFLANSLEDEFNTIKHFINAKNYNGIASINKMNCAVVRDNYRNCRMYFCVKRAELIENKYASSYYSQLINDIDDFYEKYMTDSHPKKKLSAKINFDSKWLLIVGFVLAIAIYFIVI